MSLSDPAPARVGITIAAKTASIVLFIASPNHIVAQRLSVKDAKIEGVRPEDDLIIRCESAEIQERSLIHSINSAAFGRPDEADLVNGLRAGGFVVVSLVAESEGRIVGHILFSRMSIATADGSIPAAALAPVSVLPEFQRRGIGGRLIGRGLEVMRERGERIVIVLGDPAYYRRFGFSSENTRFLKSPFPPDALMALEVSPRALEGIRGEVRYPAAFGL